MTAGFRLEGLTLRDAGGAVRVAEVSLAAGPGEALLLVGETGAGKSLIARAMLGLLPPGFAASGTLRFGDLPPIGLDRPEAVRRHWSGRTLFLPQEPRAALDPTMRVGAHLAWATPPANPLAALAAVGLPPATARLYPFALSGGMAQRVLVATALATTAPVVVVDEPTKGLDPARMHQVSALLRRLLAEGRSLLVITHDIGLVRRLGGEMAMVRDGRVVERGRAEAMLAAPRHPYTRGWAQADPAPWARPPPGPQAAAVLAGHALTAGHGGRPLFRGLDVAVRPGAVLGVAGPSGTGKTTLGNVLVGLLRPLAGRVAWQGHDPYADRTARRRLRQRFQKLHQDPATAFAPHRTLGQQMRDLEEVVPGLDTATALPPLLDRLDLAPALLGRRPADVSGGEAQRMAIARLLLLDPLVVVADEPTSRLDPLTQQRTMALLRDTLQARGVGLVLIGHDRRVLGAATDDVLVLGAP